jgi:hypothetical protein
MTWIINADMLAMMHAINFALLRPNCRAALRGDSIGDPLAVIDRARVPAPENIRIHTVAFIST